MSDTATYNVLLLADTHHPAAAVADHIHAVTQSQSVHWHIENPLLTKTLNKLDLTHFDAIGIHYSIKPYSSYYLDKHLFSALKQYQGRKFIFVQDEYSYAQRIEQTIIDLDIDLFFTLVRSENLKKAYPDPRLQQVKMVTVNTAYAPKQDSSFQRTPIKNRTVDIFYRSREYPYHLGHLGRERIQIADGVNKRSSQYGLKVDVSTHEKDRLYGQAWIARLSNAKAVLGTESGSSIWDHDGHISKKLHQLVSKQKNMSYQAAHDALLHKNEGNLVYSAISPRAYEAAAMGTPMILFPGRYSDVLKADKHYIPLAKDFSNFSDIVKKLNDDNYLQELADNTYEDLIASGNYSAEKLGEIVEECLLADIKQAEQKASAIVKQHIQTTKQKYQKHNKRKYFIAEVAFVFRNFMSLLANRNHTENNRWRALYFGARRYLVYFFARAKS